MNGMNLRAKMNLKKWLKSEHWWEIFFREHALPYILIDDFYDLVIRISVHRSALVRSKVQRITLSKILKLGLAAAWRAQLYLLLQTQRFALMFDESTSITVVKHGVIIMRFWYPALRRIVSVLWALEPIHNIVENEVDATA
ncbi:hypothetical protein QAD02_002487 [Eretmocerus hayati]|uniref:Uncharacterized protein n=1 Tax=Eretmocerus hayati TaxID=131215 RepID=A0ACC2NJ65_9HYME|nr:hypothetical protein QAD02_002487 [Eretmocerus hayati]